MTTMKWHGDRAKARARAGAADGMQAAADLVFDASQILVPEDTGDLKASGKVSVDERRLRAEITYGEGLPDPRAVIVHEKLEIRHDNGVAKYLETPLSALKPRVRQIIASSIRKKLG